jgi:hypothetical protein
MFDDTTETIEQKLNLVRKPPSSIEEVTSKATLRFIVDTIEELARSA